MGAAGSAIAAVTGGGGSGGLGSMLSGTLADLTGASKTADAYGRSANAQLAQQREDRDLALKYAVSDDELQQLQQSIALNNQDIARKQKLLASADPALIEAGTQALQLMQGKSAATLKPLQDQRNRQRQQLEQSLRQKLGPDYATSSQGQAALNQFDQQSSDLSTNAQQNAIGQYMGYVGNTEQFGNLGQNMSQQNNFAQSYANQAVRKVNAVTGNQINPGLQYAGDIYRDKAGEALINKGIGAGLGMMTKGGGGGAGGGGMAGGGNGEMFAQMAYAGGMIEDKAYLPLKAVIQAPKKSRKK